MNESDRRLREWPFWTLAAGLWVVGVVIVLAGNEILGGLVLAGVGVVLLLLRWRRKAVDRTTRGDNAVDGPVMTDMFGP